VGSRSSSAAKCAQVSLAFAYVVYDVGKQTSEAPGAGTWILVVLACGAEASILLLECCFFMGYSKSLEEMDEQRQEVGSA
jgi:hypothetical protein